MLLIDLLSRARCCAWQAVHSRELVELANPIAQPASDETELWSLSGKENHERTGISASDCKIKFCASFLHP